MTKMIVNFDKKIKTLNAIIIILTATIAKNATDNTSALKTKVKVNKDIEAAKENDISTAALTFFKRPATQKDEVKTATTVL